MFDNFIWSIYWLWENGHKALVIADLTGIIVCWIGIIAVIIALYKWYYGDDETEIIIDYDSADYWIMNHFTDDQLKRLKEFFDEMNLDENIYPMYLAYMGKRIEYQELMNERNGLNGNGSGN